MIERKAKRFAKIGIFAVGHAVYWNQFDGLYDNLMTYHHEFSSLVAENEVETVNFGMIDSSEKAYEVIPKILAAEVDIVFCNMVTYATSSVFAPIAREIQKPVILVALQPRKALDYTKANTFMQLENDNICSVPEFTGVAERMGKAVNDVIIGTLYHDGQAKKEIAEWCDIAKVLHSLHGARIGLMGHVLEAMYDMHADPTAISKTFGIHVPLLEADSLTASFENVTDEEAMQKREQILAEFDTPNPGADPIAEKLTDSDLENAARGAAALEKFVRKNHLTGLAYYYEGQPDSLQRTVISSLIVGNSILNAEGIPMCGEFDIKTCIAMLIMDRLNIGGSFAEFHPFDFEGNFILLGHDGPHHLRIANGKPVLRSLKKYHGKPGGGASVEFKIKEGPITILGITQKADGSFKFVIAEGESKEGSIPPTGNTNTRAHFGDDIRTFMKKWVKEGPTHHLALGIGHRAQTIAKIAAALGVEYVIVK